MLASLKESERGTATRINEDEIRKYKIGRLIKRTIPAKYVDVCFDNKKLLNDAIMTKKSILIHGNVGVGKTVLMASIMKDYISKNNWENNFADDNISTNGIWISYPKFIIELQSQFRDPKGNPNRYAERIAGCKGLLAIDDLGAEKLTEYVRQMTYYIINEREQNMAKTIITSNFSLKQIDAMIDTRVSSRIAGMCEIIELYGKDRRLK